MSWVLAVLSLASYQLVRIAFRIFQSAYFLVAPQRLLHWRTLSGELLNRPLALPVVMTTGPRWNPHAIISIAGPVSVVRSLRVDLQAAQRSARLWTMVVHKFPTDRIVATLGPSSADGCLDLEPGRYALVLRYYEWSSTLELPAVDVDGRPGIPGCEVSVDVNEFYAGLGRRNNWFYWWLHYYVFVMLQHRDRLPASFVRRHYLPVGNPETEFVFGSMRRGEPLSLDAARAFLPSHHVYFTLYNRASFPVVWYPVRESMAHTEPALEDGYYLIRAHKRQVVERA